MKKVIALAIFLSFFGVNLAFAQSTSTSPNSGTGGNNRGRATTTRPFATGSGIGQDVSTVNREAETQIKALRQELEAKIKALRAEYEAKVRAIRDDAKGQVKILQEERRSTSSNNKNISTSTKRFFLLRWLGRD